MNGDRIQRFCGLSDNETYVIYVQINGTLGRCFIWTALSYSSHLILLLVCVYLLFTRKTVTHMHRISWLALAACDVAFLAILRVLVEFALTYSSHTRQKHPPAYILSMSIAFSSWTICFISQLLGLTVTKEKKKSTRHLLNAFFLVLVYSASNFQYVVKNIIIRDIAVEEIPVHYVGAIIEFFLDIVFFILSLCIVLTKSMVEFHNDPDTEVRETIHLGQAESTRNVFSYVTYWWSNPLMLKGYRYQLQGADDLFDLPESLTTKVLKSFIKETLKEERENVLNELNAKGDEPTDTNFVKVSLLKVFNRCFGKVYYGIGLLKLLAVSLQLVQPPLLNVLIRFVSDPKESGIQGSYFAAAFILTSFFSVLFDLHYRYQIKNFNLKIRSTLITLIYEKALSVRSSSLSNFSTGKVLNLMSTDTDLVRQFSDNFHEVWSMPFRLIVSLYLLYQQVGVAFTAPIIYIILIMPVVHFLSKKIIITENKLLQEKDLRIKTLCEVLFGIRVIKYNAWEKYFTEVVGAIRKRELKLILVIRLLDAVSIALWSMTASILLLLTLGMYTLLGNGLEVVKVFTVMAVINQLVKPLNNFSWNINALIDAWVSLKRIEEYLSLPDVELMKYYANEINFDTGGVEVGVENGTFSWDLNCKENNMVVGRGSIDASSSCLVSRYIKHIKESKNEFWNGTPFKLKNISISIKTGQFVGVIGKVGAGKSSLFASLCAEIERRNGQVYLSPKVHSGGIALFTQEPWIQHLSIKDNILFGCEYDESRYDTVLHACALNDDLKLFPSRDATEVGEKGINLSGGQKARIALARTVYKERDVYLLDDPLSAVDAHVAKHIFRYCIMGLLKNKTRVLITHHKTYLYQSDHVISLKDGVINFQGHPEEILVNRKISSLDCEDMESDIASTEEENRDNKTLVVDESLISDEEKEVGTVSWKIYKVYLSSFGALLASITLASYMSTQAGKNLQEWWLANWASQSHSHLNNLTNSSDQSVGSGKWETWEVGGNFTHDFSVYCYIVIAYLFFLFCSTFSLSMGSLKVSRILHNLLLNSIMKTSISFFDATPVGRIINRFSTDISDIDNNLSFFVAMFLETILSFTGQMILICISLPWFTVILIPLGLLYYNIQAMYRKTSRELKRICSVEKSPIYEQFTETLSGNMTIRAFRSTERFIAMNEEKLERSQRAEYAEALAVVWLTFRLNLIGVLMVTVVLILAVIDHHYGGSNTGLVGLAITYSIEITPVLSWLLKVFTETEKRMVHVERVGHFIDDTPKSVEKSKSVSTEWPHLGVISFDKVCLRYKENLPYALMDISFETLPGEKIGVCGRTGSGKSSLLKALFNIVDLSSGNVYIDDMNISDIDHSILRSRMSIIPQDPFLFDDTISANLDPTRQHTEEEMLDVLEKCHLTKLVQNLGGLTGKVKEKGENLSAGQKQLFCIARALLKKSRILCVDEATASVDFETDKLIQKTIRTEFVSSTVLTIAHRMDTIIDYDRILVVGNGQILEFASPKELLADTSSEFYTLVNENYKECRILSRLMSQVSGES